MTTLSLTPASQPQQPTTTKAAAAAFEKRRDVARLRACITTAPTWPPACPGCGDEDRTKAVMTTYTTLCPDDQLNPPGFLGWEPIQQLTLQSNTLVPTTPGQPSQGGSHPNLGLILGLALGLGIPAMLLLMLAFLGWGWLRGGNARHAEKVEGGGHPPAEYGLIAPGLAGNGAGDVGHPHADNPPIAPGHVRNGAEDVGHPHAESFVTAPDHVGGDGGNSSLTGLHGAPSLD
ncbi:MAG: hypothetical protein Q9182_001297 [Xanthomendoza sp. 2 TL-2023]